MEKNENKKRLKQVRGSSPFASNLLVLMEERGMSQRAVSEICEVSSSVASDWVKGAAPQNLDAVQRLSRALGVSFEWLLTGEDHHPETRKLSIDELFEEHDVGLSGIFRIEAKRLNRRE